MLIVVCEKEVRGGRQRGRVQSIRDIDLFARKVEQFDFQPYFSQRLDELSSLLRCEMVPLEHIEPIYPVGEDGRILSD